MNNNRKLSVAICVFATLALVGCGQANVPDTVDTASIAVNGDGTVISYLVEQFDKEYYDISELTAMAITEAAEYNTEKQAEGTIPVTVDKVEALKDGSQKIVVTHKYDSTDTFMDYNGSILFYGTVQEALDAGYDLDCQLGSVKDDTTMTKDELLANGEKHLVITNEKVKVYCPEKVTYVSEGAVYEPNGSVDTTQADGTVVILMKK